MLKFTYIIIVLVLPIIFLGTINRVKAIWAGRKGQSLLQPYFDLVKLLKKSEVISVTTSYIFKIAPSIILACTIFAMLIMPTPIGSLAISFEGDFVLFAYILGLSKFFLIISSLDTGSSFEGMGASREATYSTIVEPAFFIILGSLALITGHLSFSDIYLVLEASSGFTLLVKILLVVALFVMILAEGSRLPVDDPNTHLELTMIHEVMILDNSGPDLAFMQYGAALKMVILSSVLVSMFIPNEIGHIYGVSFFVVGILLLAVLIGIVESMFARLRISHVPQFLFLMSALSLTLFSIILFFMKEGQV